MLLRNGEISDMYTVDIDDDAPHLLYLIRTLPDSNYHKQMNEKMVLHIPLSFCQMMRLT